MQRSTTSTKNALKRIVKRKCEAITPGDVYIIIMLGFALAMCVLVVFEYAQILEIVKQHVSTVR